MSFCPAQDHTHITQLLGRMVRNPLARRVPGDEKLNSVDCILPFFDRTTAGNVVKFLTGQADGVPDPRGRKTIISECLLKPNAQVPEEVWRVWDSLPTMTIPQRGAAPAKRLATLALALSTHGVRDGAVREAQSEMHRVLDGLKDEHETQVKKALAEIWVVRLQSIAGRLGKDGLTYTDITERADDRAIQVWVQRSEEGVRGGHRAIVRQSLSRERRRRQPARRVRDGVSARDREGRSDQGRSTG